VGINYKESYYIEGRTQGKPTRGRKRIGILSGLMGKEAYASLKRRAQDKNQWKTGY